MPVHIPIGAGMAQKPSLLRAAELLPELLGDGTQGIDRRSPVAALLCSRLHLAPNAPPQPEWFWARCLGSKRRGRVWSIDGSAATSLGETRRKFCLDGGASGATPPYPSLSVQCQSATPAHQAQALPRPKLTRHGAGRGCHRLLFAMQWELLARFPLPAQFCLPRKHGRSAGRRSHMRLVAPLPPLHR